MCIINVSVQCGARVARRTPMPVVAALCGEAEHALARCMSHDRERRCEACMIKNSTVSIFTTRFLHLEHLDLRFSFSFPQNCSAGA